MAQPGNFFTLCVLVTAFPALAQNASTGEAGPLPLVVRVDGPISQSIAAGKPLPRDRSFHLGPNDQITLLGHGGVRVLQGPGRLDGADFAPGTLVKRERKRSRLAGMRGLEEEEQYESSGPGAISAEADEPVVARGEPEGNRTGRS